MALVSRQPTLAELRSRVLFELDGRWTTPSDLAHRLDLDHGTGWLKVALVLERLANDGVAELKTAGATKRWFRRRQEPAG